MHVGRILSLTAAVLTAGVAAGAATGPGPSSAPATMAGVRLAQAQTQDATGGMVTSPNDTTTVAPGASTGATGTGAASPTVTPAVPGAITGTAAATASGIPTVLQIVEVTETVPSGGTPVSAVTVPPGSVLVITDVIVTNPGTAPACGFAIARASGQTVTGPLCAPAQTTLALPLTTGLEFAESDTAQIVNTATTATTAPVSVHLRGFFAAVLTGTTGAITPGASTTPAQNATGATGTTTTNGVTQ